MKSVFCEVGVGFVGEIVFFVKKLKVSGVFGYINRWKSKRRR